MNVDDLVKDFLSNWRRMRGRFDLTCPCERCGKLLTDGNFALVDGVLLCLQCKEGRKDESRNGR